MSPIPRYLKSELKSRKPATFLEEYENSTWQIVNKENWLNFVTR